tara:strand:+ start:170 stop:937 length:768 start_codon:yes stop_codon:yes gene_type:complete
MDKFEIHKNIYNRLEHFIKINQIPNILLHGPVGSGKRTIIYNFVDKIYKGKQDLIMYVECGHGKGIKFIRDDVNYFAKTNCSESEFKTIILLNADKLTIDAQSALRRSIELFCKTTRYFIILHDKNRLLNPLTSRFCELYVPLPKIDNKTINLHLYNIKNDIFVNKSKTIIKKYLESDKTVRLCDCFNITQELYNKGVSGLDLIDYLINHNYDEELILVSNKMKSQIKCEKILILSILNLIYFRSDSFIKNIITK